MQRAAVSTTGTAALRRSEGRTFFRPDHNNYELLERVARQGLARGLVISRAHQPSSRSHGLTIEESLITKAEALRLHWLLDAATPALADPKVTGPLGERYRAWPELDGLTLPLRTSGLADAGVCRELADRFADLQSSSVYLAAPYFDMPSRQHGASEWNIRMLEALAAASPDRPLVAFLQTTRGQARRGLFAAVARSYASAGATIVILRVRGLAAVSATGDDVGALLHAARAFESHGVLVMFDCAGRLGATLAAATRMAHATGAHNFRGIGTALLAAGGGGGSRVTYEMPDALDEYPRDSIRAQQAMPDASPADLKLHRLERYDTLASLSRPELIRVLRASSPRHRGWADAIAQAQRRSA